MRFLSAATKDGFFISSSFFSLECFFFGDGYFTSFCSSISCSMFLIYFLAGRYSSSPTFSSYFEALCCLFSMCGLETAPTFASIFLGRGGEPLFFKVFPFSRSTALCGRSMTVTLSFLCLSIFLSKSIYNRLIRSSIWSMLLSSSSESSESGALCWMTLSFPPCLYGSFWGEGCSSSSSSSSLSGDSSDYEELE